MILGVPLFQEIPILFMGQNWPNKQATNINGAPKFALPTLKESDPGTQVALESSRSCSRLKVEMEPFMYMYRYLYM